MVMDSFAEQYRMHIELVEPLTDEQIRKAQLVCADNAEDVEDLRELLKMLGLIDPGFRTQQKGYGGRGVESRERIDHE